MADNSLEEKLRDAGIEGEDFKIEDDGNVTKRGDGFFGDIFREDTGIRIESDGNVTERGDGIFGDIFRQDTGIRKEDDGRITRRGDGIFGDIFREDTGDRIEDDGRITQRGDGIFGDIFREDTDVRIEDDGRMTQRGEGIFGDVFREPLKVKREPSKRSGTAHRKNEPQKTASSSHAGYSSSGSSSTGGYSSSSAWGSIGKLFSSTFTALIVGVILYPIIGMGGCLVRVVTQGSPPSPFSPEHDKWLHNPPLDAFSIEAVYIPLLIVGIAFTLGAVNLFRLNSALRALLFVLGLAAFIYFGKTTVDSMNIRDKLARAFNLDKGSVPSGGSRETPKTNKIIKADKVTKGRTADEKVHEFVLPPNQWVETSLQITPNQEVMVHHFASNEPVKVNLGGTTDTRLRKAGTILPLYTSTNCLNDKGVQAKVQYTCVQLSQPEGVKLYANKSVRVGVVVKNR